MGSEEVLACCVGCQVLDETGDAVWLKPDLDLVKERNVRRTQRLLLKSCRQHALRAESKLP